MTLPAPTYDLVLLLDPQAEDGVRAKIVADARAAIEAQGELCATTTGASARWPIRSSASPARSTTCCSSTRPTPGCSSGLDRTLRITDGVLRFRIIKLKPGVPDAPDMRVTAQAARAPSPRRPASRPRARLRPRLPPTAEAAAPPASPAEEEPPAADTPPAAEVAVGDPAEPARTAGRAAAMTRRRRVHVPATA